MPSIVQNNEMKAFRSPGYNYLFRKDDGYFARWGATPSDDPDWSPYGNEILDIEVTTKCDGGCPFCYKSNTPHGKNMSFAMFKDILDKMPPTLTQVAFGADAGCKSNPDIFRMMRYARLKGIVPNITVARIDQSTAFDLSEVCGAVAVSRYANKDACYNSVDMLVKEMRNWRQMIPLRQVNIHQLVAEETFDDAMATVRDAKEDPRLSGLNAIVFLSLKQKGRGTHYNRLSTDKYRELVNTAIDTGVRIGFDSCSAFKATDVLPPDQFSSDTIEPCESTCFSAYIDVEGRFYPCSFAEDVDGWEEGIDVAGCKDFVKDVWMNDRTVAFRERLLDGGRKCPLYEI
jgi:MoaA/NifB/PqqE/SkfB family radical SAM enzyme